MNADTNKHLPASTHMHKPRKRTDMQHEPSTHSHITHANARTHTHARKQKHRHMKAHNTHMYACARASKREHTRLHAQAYACSTLDDPAHGCIWLPQSTRKRLGQGRYPRIPLGLIGTPQAQGRQWVERLRRCARGVEKRMALRSPSPEAMRCGCRSSASACNTRAMAICMYVRTHNMHTHMYLYTYDRRKAQTFFWRTPGGRLRVYSHKIGVCVFCLRMLGDRLRAFFILIPPAAQAKRRCGTRSPPDSRGIAAFGAL